MFAYELSGCGFESRCSHLSNLRLVYINKEQDGYGWNLSLQFWKIDYHVTKQLLWYYYLQFPYNWWQAIAITFHIFLSWIQYYVLHYRERLIWEYQQGTFVLYLLNNAVKRFFYGLQVSERSVFQLSNDLHASCLSAFKA